MTDTTTATPGSAPADDTPAPGMPASTAPPAVSSPNVPKVTDGMVRDVAAAVGVCVRPIAQRVTDTLTGTVRVVAVPCGSTRAKVCPSCAERARQARYWQCREGWHLTDDPYQRPLIETTDDDQADDDAGGSSHPDDGEADRVVRSTRRREDVAEFPVRKTRPVTVGRSFTGRDGRTYTPSMFITVTLPSYGRVDSHGVPRDPGSYDYRRAALDAVHFAKLVDRFVQNLRRCAGYKVQYFAAVEPQRRGAPHLHIAIRGTLPRADVRQVIAATYHQVWWPPCDEPVYTDPDTYPVWDARINDGAGGYLDPSTGAVLPTWDEALPGLDDDPAHVVRFGTQADIQGLIAGSKADKTIGYLTKYLSKSLGDDFDPDDDPADDADSDDEASRVRAARRAHLDRIHAETCWLPCSPSCANWLRYGVQPKNADRGMEPGQCPRKAHDRDHLGHGGRRVLVSRHWTGKTLGQAKADRATVVRETLAAAGVTADDHDELSATATSPDGHPRYRWEPIEHGDLDTVAYARLIATAIRQRARWRDQYERARALVDRPPGDLSATDHPSAADAA